MTNSRSRRLFAASTSVLALAVTPVFAGDAGNVSGIIAKSKAEGADYVSTLRIPQGIVNVFGADVVSERGVAKAAVNGVKGEDGGAIRQKVEVEYGDGGAVLINDGDTTIQAVSAATSEKPRKDVLASSKIAFGARQDVEVDEGRSVDLSITNNNAFSVNSSATGAFALSSHGDGNADHAAIAVVGSGTVQHADARGGGNGSVSLTNAQTGVIGFSAEATLAPNESAEGNPAQSGNAIAILGRPVDQRAWGVDASALVNNAGLFEATASASTQGTERAASLAAVVRGVSQDVAGEATASATLKNQGDMDIVARSSANGSNRADAGAVVFQGVAQNVSAGNAGSASVVNGGNLHVDADATASAGKTAKANAFIGQAVGQHVESNQSSAVLENTGSIQGHAVAQATSGDVASEVARDRAVAQAGIGLPLNGSRLPLPAFGALVDEHLKFDGHDDKDHDANSYGSGSGSDYGHGDEDSDDHYDHHHDVEEAPAMGPLAGISQVAIGSTASINNAGTLAFGSEASATGINRARASASTLSVAQISQGNEASASYSGTAGSILSAESSAIASADNARARSGSAGILQNADGVETATVSFTSAGTVTVAGSAAANGVSKADSSVIVGGVLQNAAADVAKAQFAQTGTMHADAHALAGGAAANEFAPSGRTPEQLLEQFVIIDGTAYVVDDRFAAETANGEANLVAVVSQSVVGNEATASASNAGPIAASANALSAGATDSNATARIGAVIAQQASGEIASINGANSGQLSANANSIALGGASSQARSQIAAGVTQQALGGTASAVFNNSDVAEFSAVALARADSANAAAEIGSGIGQFVESNASTATITNSDRISGTVLAAAHGGGAGEGNASASGAIGASEGEFAGGLVSQQAIGSTVSLANTGQIGSLGYVTAQGVGAANATGSVVNVAQSANGSDAAASASNAKDASLSAAGLVFADGNTASAQYQGVTLAQIANGEVSKVSLTNAGEISAQGAAGADGIESASADSNAYGVMQSAFGDAATINLRNSGMINADSFARSSSAGGSTAFASATAYLAGGDDVTLDVVNSREISASADGQASGYLAVSATAAEFVAEEGPAALAGSVSNSGTIRATATGFGEELTSVMATGVSFHSGVNSAVFNNTGLIETNVKSAAGAERASTGILVTGLQLDEVPDATFTINNNGGTIVSRVANEGLARSFAFAAAPGDAWLRGTAIDTRNAPNAVTVNFTGASNVYGNIEISGDDRLDVRSGELTFEGVVNTDRELRGHLAVQGGATLYMVDPVNRSAASGYVYEGASKVNVETLTFKSGSTLALQLPTSSVASIAQAEYPQLRADTARLAGTLEVRLPTPNGLYDDYFFDNVIDSNDLGGTRFDRVVTSYLTPLLKPEARYDAFENVDLIIDRIGFGAVPGLTYNQTQVGNGIENVYSPTQQGPFGTLLANLFKQGPAAYPVALDQLSGAEYAGYVQAVRNLSQQVSTNLNDQLTCVRDKEDKCEPKSPGLRIFAMAGHGSSNVDFDGNSSGYDANGVHILFGAGYGNGGFSIAGFGGYREVNVEFSRFGNEMESDGWQAGIVTGYEGRDAYIRANANYSKLEGNSERNISIGTTAGEITGDVNAEVFALNTEIGARLRLGKLLVSPFVALDYTSVKLDEIREQGVPGANLTLGEQQQDQTSMFAGVKWSLRSDTIVPEIKAAYRHDFGDEFFLSSAMFTDAPMGSRFTVRSPRIDRDSFILGGSLAAALGKRATGRLGYLGRLNGQAKDHAVYGSLVLRFGATEAAPPPPPPPPPPPTPPPPPPPPPPSPICDNGSYLVFFDFDSILLTPEARTTLDTVADAYGTCGSPTVVVTGHTDRAGSALYNGKLSLRRAETVKSYLLERKVVDAITTLAKGEAEPRVATPDGVANAQNRRVEIVYQEDVPVDAVAPAAVAEVAPAAEAAPAPAPAPEAAAATAPAEAAVSN